MKAIEEELKERLGTSKFELASRASGGCISKAGAYQTDNGVVFVKFNDKDEVSRLVG